MINLLPQVFAAGTNRVDIETPATANNFFGYTCIANLISNLISVSLMISAVVFFAFLVMGGLGWLTSSGDKAQVENAQKKITNALIGLVIIASSWAIYQLVLYFFGINLDNICSTTPV